MNPVLAAAYIQPITDLLTGLKDEIFALLVPAGIIGMSAGVVLWLLGSQHAPNTLRVSAIALAIGGAIKTIVPAFIGS